MTESVREILDNYLKEEKLASINYLAYCLQFDCYLEEDKECFREAIRNLSKNI